MFNIWIRFQTSSKDDLYNCFGRILYQGYRTKLISSAAAQQSLERDCYDCETSDSNVERGKGVGEGFFILCVQEVVTHFIKYSYYIKRVTTSWTYSKAGVSTGSTGLLRIDKLCKFKHEQY